MEACAHFRNSVLAQCACGGNGGAAGARMPLVPEGCAVSRFSCARSLLLGCGSAGFTLGPFLPITSKALTGLRRAMHIEAEAISESDGTHADDPRMGPLWDSCAQLAGVAVCAG